MTLHSWFTTGIVAIALVVAPSFAAAQSTLAAADAAAFLGTWTLTVESPQGPFDQTLELKDAGGKVSAQLTSALAPTATDITDVAKSGDDLVLKFQGDFQGNAFTAKITMTPNGGDKVKVAFDVMDGQFVMDGTGVKK